MYVFGTGEKIPLPSPIKRGQNWVEVPPGVVAKILLHNEMVRQKVRPIELARRMGVTAAGGYARPKPEAQYQDRHDLAQALHALGKRLEMRVA